MLHELSNTCYLRVSEILVKTHHVPLAQSRVANNNTSLALSETHMKAIETYVLT